MQAGSGMFGKADPYCKVVIGTQEFSTRPHKVRLDTEVLPSGTRTRKYYSMGRNLPVKGACCVSDCGADQKHLEYLQEVFGLVLHLVRSR